MTNNAPNAMDWWNSLRHSGLLLDPTRLSTLVADAPESLSRYEQDRLRRRIDQFIDDPETHRHRFVAFVMEHGLAFHGLNGYWHRGSEVSKDWSRKAITGESIRPQLLWHGAHRSLVPVFVDHEQRLGLGRGKRIISQTLQWLRQTENRLAVITNGFEWRIVFAGLDYDAWCQWDIAQWFTEGTTSAEFHGLRSLLNQRLWTKPAASASAPLLTAIDDSRKGQAELSQVLGERVRQAVELLIQGHGPVLSAYSDTLDPAEIYRAGVRIIMRMVVVLFAESRDALLPRDNPIYHSAYSLAGLRDQLERMTEHRRRSSYGAWPRMVSLFRLVYDGSAHEALTVPSYGGQLFEPGDASSEDGVRRALAVLENGCFDHDIMTDQQVARILDLLSRTKIRIRQGRQFTWVPAPVDFSSLDNEYIGILYEGLLDFELRQATAANPIIFLAVGNQPALSLATLEAMDDKALRNLLEKMKDTSSGSDDSGDGDGGDGDGEESAGAAESEPTGEADEQLDSEGSLDPQAPDRPDDDASAAVDSEESMSAGDGDDRHTIRGRAEAWAQRAIAVGKLVRKPAGTLTAEKQLQYQAELAAKARQIITKTVLPGEWYLVRWGGTRKGSGTFYTRPQLAIPTVHRTLRPLACDPPLGADGQPDLDAPIDQWIPRRPEHILNLKICDPACGSGSFLLAALRFLTEALYASLHYHQRFRHFSDRTVIDIIRDEANEQTLTDERLPCRPEDADFEQRTKAVLRRYVVERCIYGVDLDPLAVELCRLSLWIETLDPRLPFTFLDHKIKCGNSLIGTWFDQFMHYPAMAWMREGGDKSHSNGVHFRKEAWTKAIKAKVPDVRHELMGYIDGGSLLNQVDLTRVRTVHDDAERALQAIHALGIHEAERRAEQYRELRASESFLALKEAFDLWCAIWFWPPERIDACPLPLDFYERSLSAETQQISRDVAARVRFFHWELEFPDVFRLQTLGFDAILGNPPWDIAKPNSKEFFSGRDPLYRSYGKQEAIGRQKAEFEMRRDTELRWLSWNAGFRAQSNWVKYAGHPFGDRVKMDGNERDSHDLNLGDRGRSSFATGERRHGRWRQKREELAGYADAEHAFRHQGGGDINLYKMFLEQSYTVLRDGGRLGMIVPSGIYSDHGTGNLRTLFLDRCQWQWLFGFENRDKIFSIDSRFKFNPIILQKGGQTTRIRSAFMRRNLADWEIAEQLATDYPRERVLQFSPRSKAILEIQSRRDLDVLERIYSNSVLLGDDSPHGWGITYSREFDMTNDSKLFPPRTWWEEQGYRPDEYSRWIKGNWQPRTKTSPAPLGCKRIEIPEGIILSRDGESWISEETIAMDSFVGANGTKTQSKAVALPLFEGRMVGEFDFSQKGWVSGNGREAVWREVPWECKQIEPQYLMAAIVFQDDFNRRAAFSRHGQPGQVRVNFQTGASIHRVAFMDVASATNERTMIAAPAVGAPYGNSAPLFYTEQPALLLTAPLTTFLYDFIARQRCGGLHLNWFVVDESPLPKPLSDSVKSAIAPVLFQLFGDYRHGAMAALHLRLNPLPMPALTVHERLRCTVMTNVAVALLLNLSGQEFAWILRDCDLPAASLASKATSRCLPTKGFWRLDKRSNPEHRVTVLSLVSFIDAISGARGTPVENAVSFLTQNDGEGWQLPETLRLADYGLGHDDRAQEHQPVRAHFGPRFYDWQLAQSPEESWQECHLHTRNLLGPTAYQTLLDEHANPTQQVTSSLKAAEAPASKTSGKGTAVKRKEDQRNLF